MRRSMNGPDSGRGREGEEVSRETNEPEMNLSIGVGTIGSSVISTNEHRSSLYLSKTHHQIRHPSVIQNISSKNDTYFSIG